MNIGLQLKEMLRTSNMPNIRGSISFDKDLSKLSWLKVGGPAEVFFQPYDTEDLSKFLKWLPKEVSVFVIGACSNLIIRDGGIPGVTIRLGRNFSDISFDEKSILVGAALLDSQVANKAAQKGLDLAFLRTIPGVIGGAVVMNAGCYGKYIADVLIRAKVILRDGSYVELNKEDFRFGYRSSLVPEGAVVTEVVLKGDIKPFDEILKQMDENISHRMQTQPVKERSCGSTFRNPSGASSTLSMNSDHSMKAWSLIEQAGLRGFRFGGAELSKKHPNFMINTGTATANDLECLGKLAIEKVELETGIKLIWEIKRIGIKKNEDQL